MLWVRHSAPWAPATRQRRVISLRGLLDEQAEDGLAGLHRGAKTHGAEIPRVCCRFRRSRLS